MKKQLFIGTRAFVRRLGTAAILLSAVTMAVACDEDDPNTERSESIQVYTDMDEEPVDAGVYVDVRGGAGSLYVKSNVDYEVFWQDGETKPWAKIIERRENVRPGIDEIVLQFKPRQTYSYYTRRGGTLSFSSSQNKLGKFVTIYQGAVARVSQTFTWLTYGNASPLITDGEKAYSGWTAVQKNYNWKTTTENYCFGRNGYVKLGDEQGHGADLITPYVNDMRSDSLLMVSFRAVAYSDAANVQDQGQLTVNILGGGVFADTGLTTREVQLGTYKVENGTLAESMWLNSNYLLFVVKTDKSPITADTQIQFVSGSLTEVGSQNNRIFLDNIYVYTLNELNEDMAQVNQGTDKDIILGTVEETPEE